MKKYMKFVYPDYGAPASFPGHVAHSGQKVQVIREVKNLDPEVERTFLIRASDGWEGEAFASELS